MAEQALGAWRQDDEGLLERYQAVRARSMALCEPLAVEDMVIQAMADTSPPKWHLAHTSWFFETFLLKPHLPGYQEFHPGFAFLFNSYYEQVGPFFPRPQRGLLSRPTVAEVLAYRQHVDEAMARLLTRVEPARLAELQGVLLVGLNHEQQHQELLLMDVKYNLSINPLYPAYTQAPPPSPRAALQEGLNSSISHPGGVCVIGDDGLAGFAYDNEGPRHKVLLEPFRLARRLVTCGEYLAFIEAGGYRDPTLWMSDGWAHVQRHGWTAPLYWVQSAEGWQVFTLHGLRPLDLQAPVGHLSWYEADALARFAGQRLPTEAEWEVAVVAGNARQELAATHSEYFEPHAGGMQFFGALWQWTASPYVPYPRYRPVAGALGEYNGKFMAGQMVLRGSACITPPAHARATYRNFFPPQARWMYGGVRLAQDA